MTNKINSIDVSEYFINHYDNSGKLYAVEYKGNPLELQNAIKRLQEENEELGKIINCKTGTIQSLAKVRDDLKQENEELKKRLNGCLNSYGELYGTTNTLAFEHAKYKQALEEIRDRLIVVTEEEPQSTINLVLDLKPIIEGVLNDRD